MFLFTNAFVASLDGFAIGIGLKLCKTKLTFKNNITLFLTNVIIYSFALILYYSFHFHFMTKSITTILYLFLAYNAYKDEHEDEYEKTLSLKNTFLLAAVHSLDGSIVSLNFVYAYSLATIILVFSIASILLLFIGYYFANFFKDMKKSNLWSAFLFVFLAIVNLIL